MISFSNIKGWHIVYNHIEIFHESFFLYKINY
jgi:hypothetical protein